MISHAPLSMLARCRTAIAIVGIAAACGGAHPDFDGSAERGTGEPSRQDSPSTGSPESEVLRDQESLTTPTQSEALTAIAGLRDALMAGDVSAAAEWLGGSLRGDALATAELLSAHIEVFGPSALGDPSSVEFEESPTLGGVLTARMVGRADVTYDGGSVPLDIRYRLVRDDEGSLIVAADSWSWNEMYPRQRRNPPDPDDERERYERFIDFLDMSEARRWSRTTLDEAVRGDLAEVSEICAALMTDETVVRGSEWETLVDRIRVIEPDPMFEFFHDGMIMLGDMNRVAQHMAMVAGAQSFRCEPLEIFERLGCCLDHSEALAPPQTLRIDSADDLPEDERAVLITVTVDAILVEMEIVGWINQDGVIPATRRVSETSFVIPSVQVAIEDLIHGWTRWHQPTEGIEQPPSALIVADRHTRFDTLISVMVTASAGGVGAYDLAVHRTDRFGWQLVGRLPVSMPDISDPQDAPAATLSITPGGFTVTDSQGHTVIDGFDYRLLYNRLVEARDIQPASGSEPPTLAITAARETDYQTLVHAIETAYIRRAADRYDDVTFDAAPRHETTPSLFLSIRLVPPLEAE